MTQIPKSFFRSVSILFTGTVIAQIISYTASPIISRQYLPEDNAYLGLFLRITALGAAIATARLELAFPVEKQNHHAFGIYRFSMRFSLMLSFFALVIVLIFSGIDYISFQNFLFLLSLPFGIFLTALFNQGASWSLRNEDYSTIAKSSLLLSFFTNVLKVLLGLIKGNFLFLIGATLLAFCLSIVTFMKNYMQVKTQSILTYNSKRTRVLVAKNSDLYMYNLPHVLIDLARDLLLASIIWNCYGKMEFGSYDHAFRMLKLPIVFIGSAIGQVLFKKCSVLINEKKSIFPLVLRVSFILIGISIVPFMLIGFFGPQLFTFVFGEKWKLAGEMASTMVPWLLINFISSPLSHIPILLNKQKKFFWVNLIGTICVLMVVLIPYLGIISITSLQMLNLLSISQSVFLFCVLIWLLSLAWKGKEIKL